MLSHCVLVFIIKKMKSLRAFSETTAYFFLLIFIGIWFLYSVVSVSTIHSLAKSISYMYTYVPSFLDFLPVYLTTEHWVPCAIQ